MAQSYDPSRRYQGGFSKITDTLGSNEPPQPNEQQMLAQALRGSGGMPQQQLSEEEKMMIMQLMQQGMTQEQAMQELMRMKSVA